MIMSNHWILGLIFFFILICPLTALEFCGQVSVSGTITTNTQTEIRYIPTVRMQFPITDQTTIDTELALNINTTQTDWYRGVISLYSGPFDLQAGLQKINFGPARVLRPLQWFDALNPLDQLNFTSGIYGIQGRYVFDNNANIRAWRLYEDWDSVQFGGRVQTPVLSGESAATFHYNKTTLTDEEFRYGLDGVWDIEIGLWLESAVYEYRKNNARTGWYQALTLGGDYTFEIENGVHVLIEHMIHGPSTRFLDARTLKPITIGSLDYSLSIIDSLQLLISTDWENPTAVYLSWNSIYDEWIFQAAYIYLNDHGAQITMTWNH